MSEVIVPFRYPDPVEYRDIVDHPGYRVGNDGSIWCCKGRGAARGKSQPWRRLKTAKVRSGHLKVCLKTCGKKFNKFVHLAVVEAFVGPKPDKCECRHFPDINPENNSLLNLSWGTRQQNRADSVIHGTANRGSRCGTSVLTEEQVIEMRADRSITERAKAKKYGVSHSTIQKVMQKKWWKHVI